MESHVVGRFVKRALFHPLRLSAIASSHGTHTTSHAQHHSLTSSFHCSFAAAALLAFSLAHIPVARFRSVTRPTAAAQSITNLVGLNCLSTPYLRRERIKGCHDGGEREPTTRAKAQASGDNKEILATALTLTPRNRTDTCDASYASPPQSRRSLREGSPPGWTSGRMASRPRDGRRN